MTVWEAAQKVWDLMSDYNTITKRDYVKELLDTWSKRRIITDAEAAEVWEQYSKRY